MKVGTKVKICLPTTVEHTDMVGNKVLRKNESEYQNQTGIVVGIIDKNNVYVDFDNPKLFVHNHRNAPTAFETRYLKET